MIAPTPHPAITLVLADSFTIAPAMTCTENAMMALIQIARAASGERKTNVISQPASAMSARDSAANRATAFTRPLREARRAHRRRDRRRSLVGLASPAPLAPDSP